jgi:glycogen synthase
VQVVLDLAKLYPDKRFIIVRSPAEPTHGIPNLEEQAAKLANVELHPRVSPEEVYKYLEQTRILLVPSMYETYGMSAIEAAGFGIPSIHVDTPHVREGIGDAAILIKPLDLDGAASGIDLIESNYDSYSDAARIRAEFIHDRQNDELEKFSYFVDNLKMPKDSGVRQRLITVASRKNRHAS